MNRRTASAVGIVLALSCAAPLAVDPQMLERAAVRHMARADLRALGRASGLTDAPGERLPVFVQQDGGPLWVGEVVGEAVQDTTWTRIDAASPHRLQVEVARVPGAWALRLSLWRQGWSLRSPIGQRLHLAPWVFTASAACGVLVTLAVGRVGWGLLVAGLLAQVFACLLPSLAVPLASGEAAGGVIAAWRTGPLAQGIVALAHASSDRVVGVGVAVAALCLLLVVLDHRRSRGRGGTEIAWGMAGVFAALAWLEAGARTGLAAYAVTAMGAVGLATLLGLWAWTAVQSTRAR